MTLIVGGDSQIGRALRLKLESVGANWAVTTRRDGGLALDLAGDASCWRLPKADIAVLCAAVTKIQACEDDPAGTRRLNVGQTVELARRLAAQGAFVVFLSTNLVFDGSRPRPESTQAKSPQCEYGRQKSAAEEGIASVMKGQCAIVRLTKVVGRGVPLVTQWRKAWQEGGKIEAFGDLPMASIPMDWAAAGVLKIAHETQGGIFQLSAAAEISYADVARELARRCGVGMTQIIEVSAHAAGHPCVPRYASLGMGERELELGLIAPDPWAAWEECFQAV